uniref:Deleted in lung and esophageal cancer 1 n=1 Tax=Jaculus jaculus TaxID=51337 RepID=A0A8C5P4T4_JACJA
QRLDEVTMLERHIIQARARDLAETERVTNEAKINVLETMVKLPPVKTIFRWCVDSELLRKHHLICPEDYYNDPVPFCSAPKATFLPGCSKETFSSEKHAVQKAEGKKFEASLRGKCTLKDELAYAEDSLTCDSSTEDQHKIAPKKKKWMDHLRVPDRAAERLLLARMETRNHFLKNPRFFPPNTPHGGKSLIVPPRKLGERGFLYSLTFAQMVITLQNTTATSRYLRVIPPVTPYFALGLGMFPGKGGMVAPGMACQHTVQFVPDCLGDFDDFILVETQSAHTLVIPLQARRPPPVLTLSAVLNCGYCLIGGVKITRFICKNVGFSSGKFCIMPQKSWPPPSFRAVATTGLVEQPPFGVMPSVFELAPGFSVVLEVLFLPTSLGKSERTFVIVCDNCQMKELVIEGTGQLVALDLIHISGEKSEPDPGELRDLTAQYFIRFESENLQSVARKHLVIRNATQVELPFHWQITKPNLQPLMPGETYSMESIKYHPDKETAFSIVPKKGVLGPHSNHEFILSFSPFELRRFHSVLQMVLENIPEPLSLEVEDLEGQGPSVDDVIVLEIEAKGSAEPFQIRIEPYALIIPGENYIGINVKKNFKMWNNSKSAIRYTWAKISDCHIIEVEPCTGVIEPNEVGDFVLNFTGGVPGPTSQDLLCEIRHSPWPEVLHIEATFKGPALVIDVPALQFDLLRLGQKASRIIHIHNISQLPAMWQLRESPLCVAERDQGSPFDIEPWSGQLHPLGECQVVVTLEASHCQRLQTVLQLEVENGTWSYIPVYAEVQRPYVYLQSSHVELSDLYTGVPVKSTVTLTNGTLLLSRFHWGKLLGTQAALCTVTVSPIHGLLGPNEERHIHLELTAHTQEELTDLVLPCHVTGMEEPLVLGISGKPQGLQVTIAISVEGSDSVSSHAKELCLDFGSKVPLRTCVTHQLILTNCSPIETPFTLMFEYFGSPQSSLSNKTSLPDMPPALLKSAHIKKHLAKKEHLDFMDSMLAHKKGAAFFPHVSQGVLRAYQKLSIGITGCANMWGKYWDNLLCTVGDLPLMVIPVHMAVVGCPVSTVRNIHSMAHLYQKEPMIRFGTQVSGGDTVSRTLRLYNSSPCDIRLDWQTYVPEDRDDRLLELLVFYGPHFPLRDHAGNELVCPESPEASILSSASPFDRSESSQTTPSLVSRGVGNKAQGHIISVILQGHEGVPSDCPYHISPKQVVVPAGGNSTICVSFTPTVLGPTVLDKAVYTGYALGFMSLDRAEREIPGRRQRLQDFDVGPLRLDLHGHVRRAQLSVELDSSGYLEFRCQASDLIPSQPCCGVPSELLTTRHLKLINITEIPHYFRLLVSKPFSASRHGAASRGRRASRRKSEEELALGSQENMLVDVSFSLSLELLSYQRLPADQMLPGVDIQQSTNGEKEMVFTRLLLLRFTNQTTQEVPLRATVAVPELQLSTSWVDFGTCYVNQKRTREVYLMNLSGCQSYWTVLMGKQEMHKEAEAFGVFPHSGLLEARPTSAPPTSVLLQVFFTPRSSAPYESTLAVEGVLGEKACTLRLRGQGSYDERYVVPHQL